MDFEQSLGFIIARTHTKMKNSLAKALKPYDITPEQWSLLNRLLQQDGISQRELSEKSLKDQPTTARILNILEQRGLIRRQVDPEDKRSFLIYLTSEGRDIRHPLTNLAHQGLEKSLKGLSEQERVQLKILQNRIIDNID